MGSETSELKCHCFAPNIQAMYPNTTAELRLQTSESLKFDDEARSKRFKTALREGTPYINPHESISPESRSKSCDNIYCFEGSLSSSMKEKPASIKIPQSSTTSADYKFESAVIPKKKRNKVSSKELYEMRLKRQQEEQDLLKQENDVLRKRLYALQNKYDINELVNEKTISTDTETDGKFGGPIYELLSPSTTPITSNYNMSPYAYAHDNTPSGYSHSKDTDTDIDIDVDTDIDTLNEEEEAEYVYITKTMRMKKHDVDVMDSNDEEEEEEEHCDSIQNCMPIKRIIIALRWYSTYGDDYQSVYRKMNSNNYGAQITDDYQHIMQYHLVGTNTLKEYNWICVEVDKFVEPCSAVKCNGYRRYLKWIHCDDKTHKSQDKIQRFVNTMDGIHCCFLHLAKPVQF